MASIFDRLADSVASLTGEDRLAVTVARLTDLHDQAKAEADRLQLEHENLLADRALAGEPLDGAAVSKALAVAMQARDKAVALAAALATAKARLSAAEATSDRAAHRARWASAVGAAERKHAAMKRLQKTAAALAADYTEVLRINEELTKALPANPDEHAALTQREALETVLRRELHRAGLTWAFQWPWGATSIPDFGRVNDEALDVVRAWAPKD